MTTKICKLRNCKRCGHEWWDKGKRPRQCAKCKTFLYEVPRVKAKAKR